MLYICDGRLLWILFCVLQQSALEIDVLVYTLWSRVYGWGFMHENHGTGCNISVTLTPIVCRVVSFICQTFSSKSSGLKNIKCRTTWNTFLPEKFIIRIRHMVVQVFSILIRGGHFTLFWGEENQEISALTQVTYFFKPNG